MEGENVRERETDQQTKGEKRRKTSVKNRVVLSLD